tara:strand:+ start:116 stop:319 length:204 start_codon:yes stop_codon:yes gene_type:complete
MDSLKKIADLKKSIQLTNQLIDKLTDVLKSKENKIHNKENQIKDLKKEIRINAEKIDQIIEDYNANI